MKKVIVTGANGLIGSHILKELVLDGVEVIAVIKDRFENVKYISALKGIRFVYCDLEDISSLSELVSDRDIDACIYLAWAGASGEARSNYNLQLSNVRYALDTVNAIASMGIKRFVCAGTLMELDAINYIPSDGSQPNAVSHYPAAKIAARYMTNIECTRLGIDFVWCMISNTYGPNIRSGFVHYAASRFINGEKAEFTPGDQLYDFMFIQDTARAFVDVTYKGKSSCTYYLGSSKPRKLKDYILAIRDAVDPSIEMELGAFPFRGVSLSKSDLDSHKMIEDTGFKANMSFEEGIAITVEWLKKDLNIKKDL